MLELQETKNLLVPVQTATICEESFAYSVRARREWGKHNVNARSIK
jgi:hypothetical protein